MRGGGIIKNKREKVKINIYCHEKKEVKCLKKQLIILSLSPLFLLTILQYFPFEKFGRVVGNLFNIQMIYKHLPLYIGMWVCLIWVMVSLIIFIKFVCFQRYDVVGGYEVKDIKEEKDAGLNFFLTLILPLLVNDISTWNGLLLMIFLVAIIICLLSKTNLYYQNPVLIILKYNVYKFKFVDNEHLPDGEYIALIRGNMDSRNTIEYKKIEDNVLVIRKEG